MIKLMIFRYKISLEYTIVTSSLNFPSLVYPFNVKEGFLIATIFYHSASTAEMRHVGVEDRLSVMLVEHFVRIVKVIGNG